MAKVNQISPARLAAFEILRRVEEGAFSSVLLAAREDDLKPVDRALCHELVMGVLRWQFHLDKIIEHFAGRKAKSLDLGVRLALRLGLYQLRYLSRVPASAAVNESVNMVLHARLGSARGLVNAVLRRATREPPFDPAANIADPVEKLAIEASHPVWLIDRWVKEFGPEHTRELAWANNQTPPTAIRVVRNRATESDILTRLRTAGAEVKASALVEGAWRVTGANSLLRDLAKNGEIYRQDEASQLVAGVVNPGSSDKVLDVCAAPGSKTTQMADRAGDRALIVAGDRLPKRLSTLLETSAVQQLNSIQCLLYDATLPLPFYDDAFDQVLVDAPCSGTGTLRHNPEIRWRITAEDIGSLAVRQKQLLLNAARVTKPGGRLVYSTCSVEFEENEDVISDFLRNNDLFEQIPVQAKPMLLTASGAARTWPQREGADGFFMAVLQRRK